LNFGSFGSHFVRINSKILKNMGIIWHSERMSSNGGSLLSVHKYMNDYSE